MNKIIIIFIFNQLGLAIALILIIFIGNILYGLSDTFKSDILCDLMKKYYPTNLKVKREGAYIEIQPY